MILLRLEQSFTLALITFISQTATEAQSRRQFPRKALDASVKKKVASGQPLPSYEDGYQDWKDAYAQKRAGVYVVSVADAVSVAEKTFQKGIGCE